MGDKNFRETLKAGQLDGAFIIDDDGAVLSAARLIDDNLSAGALASGLGACHAAALSISAQTVAVVVSESSVVRRSTELISCESPTNWRVDQQAGGVVAKT